MASVLDKYIQQLSTGTSVANKPAGGINAYNIDPRLGKSYQQLVSAVNSGISNEPAGTDVLSKYLNQLTDFSKPAKKKLNPLQEVLSNRVVQAGLKPLEILDYGRRGLTSLAKESYDYGKTGTFSIEDLKTQTQDPTFGVGKFVNTGNKWADRGLGFAGDVALDPLNYLTLGAGQFVGAGGRAALAAKLVRAGADEAVISKAGRLGLAGLSNAEREAFSLPRAGLYVGNPSKSGVRIPGTGAVGQGLGRTLGEARSLLGSTPVGGVVRRARTPEMFIDAAERLATGKGRMSAVEAASLLSSAKKRAGVEGVVRAEIDQELRPIMDSIRSSANPRMVTDALERGDLSNPIVAQVREQFDRNFNRMSAPDMGAISPDRYRTNYVPRIWTEAGQNILSNESPFAKQFREAFGVTVDDVRSPTATMSRVLNIEPGKVYNIGGKELTFATDTIDEINRVFRTEFPQLGNANVLEDDITKLLSGHSRQTAQAIGNQALARELEALGVGKAVALASTGVVDKEATKVAEAAQKAATAQFAEDMKPRVAAAAEAEKVALKEYNDAVKTAGESVGVTLDAVTKRLNANGVTLAVKLQDMQKAFSNFLVRNKTAQIGLEEQGRNLDNMAAWLTDFIDENNTKLDLIAGFTDSPEGVRLLAEKEYADSLLGNIKDMQSSLDSSIRKIDGATVNLPVIKDLPATVKKTAETRMLPEPKYIEPYRIVKGGEIVGREKNTVLQFTDSLNNSRNLVGAFSPEAHNALLDAGVALDKASLLEKQLRRNATDVANVENAVFRQEVLQSRYDRLRGILDRYNSRASKLRSQPVFEGKISYLPRKDVQEILKNGLLDREDLKFMQLYEDEILPAVNRAENVRAETLRLDNEGATFQIEDLRRQAEENARNAKDIAMREVQGMVDTPWFSVDVQNKILASYEKLFEEYQKGVEVVRRLNTVDRDNLTSGSARAAIKDAAAITAGIEEATFRFRVNADFANRYKGVISEVVSTGVPFDADAIAAYVIKNVLDSEIVIGRSQLDTLRQAEQNIIKGLIDETKTGGSVGNVGTLETVAKTLANKKDKDSTFLNNILKEYIDTLYEFNRATRSKGTTGRISDTELTGIGAEVSEDVGARTGYSTTNLQTPGSEQLQQDLTAIRQSIVDFVQSSILGGADTEFNFKKFITSITTDGKGKARTSIDDDALKVWFDKNYSLQQQQPSRYLRFSEQGQKAREAKNLSGQSDAALNAITEQIQNVQKRVDSLTENAKLFGRKTRVSAADKRAMANVVDINDPAAIADATAKAKARRTAIAGTKTQEGELAKLDALISENRKTYSATAKRQKWKQPKGEAAANLVKLNEQVIKMKEEVEKYVARGNDVPEMVSRRLEQAKTRLSSAEDAQLVFSGRSKDLQSLTTEHNALITKKAEFNAELKRLGYEISEGEALLKNPIIKVGLEKNKALKNWESVLFGEGLGKSKFGARNLFRQQANLIREQVGLRAEAEAAQALADAAQGALEETGRRVVGTNFTDASGSTRMALEMSKEKLDQVRLAKEQIAPDLDNTKQIGIDASIAESEALIDVRNQIDAVRNNARAVIDARQQVAGTVPTAKGLSTIEASSKWLDEALAMTDPNQYMNRVGLTDTVGNLVDGTSEAQKFAYLFSMNYTPEQKATAALVAKAHSLEGQMLTAVENRQAVESMIRGAKDLKFAGIMKQQIQDGWQEISKSGIVVPQPVADAMTRIMQLDKPSEWRKFWSAWDTYTDVFKAYATLSPRFHVRNSLSATLMNYSDGVSTKSMIDGVRYWREFKNNPSGWIDNVPAEERKMIAEAVEATYATGAGQYQEFKIGTKGTRNRVVKASQNVGTTVEGSVRLGMAIDTLRKGGSPDEAVARISRVHFNYSDVSKVDGYAKKVIPFWTFMSRNLPLQMQQMWLKPRLYAIYGSAVRNFTDDEDNSIVPSYMMDSGAFKSPVGAGLITPDMPWIKARQDIMNLASPSGLISSATPLVKLPVELYTGKSTFTGAPIKNPALYAAQQALPLYQTFERLGGVGSQGAKQGSNIAGFLGIPYQQPTVGQQNSELLNRLALAKQTIDRARK